MSHNIILQHYDGFQPVWALAAEKTVRNYASEVGAIYEFVQGLPCGKEAGPYAQKLHMLDEKFDEFDQVLMLDMDVIATNVYDNIFDIPQIGVLHSRAMKNPESVNQGDDWKINPLYKQGKPLFFGSVIKLDRDMRIKMRKHLDWDYFNYVVKNQYGSDELIMHYCLHKSGVLEDKSFYEMCMRRDGPDLDNIRVRDYDRYDKRFANQPEDSDLNASLIHFCAARKRMILPTVKKIFGDRFND